MGENRDATSTVVSLTRAQSSLELLSQTAAWKQESDNDAKSEAGIVEDDDDDSTSGSPLQQPPIHRLNNNMSSATTTTTESAAAVVAPPAASTTNEEQAQHHHYQQQQSSNTSSAAMLLSGSSNDNGSSETKSRTTTPTSAVVKSFLPPPLSFGSVHSTGSCQYGFIGEHDDEVIGVGTPTGHGSSNSLYRPSASTALLPSIGKYFPSELFLAPPHSFGCAPSVGHETMETTTTTTTTTTTRTTTVPAASANATTTTALSVANNGTGTAGVETSSSGHSSISTNSTGRFLPPSSPWNAERNTNLIHQSSASFVPPRPSLNQRITNAARDAAAASIHHHHTQHGDPWNITSNHLQLQPSSSNSSLASLLQRNNSNISAAAAANNIVLGGGRSLTPPNHTSILNPWPQQHHQHHQDAAVLNIAAAVARNSSNQQQMSHFACNTNLGTDSNAQSLPVPGSVASSAGVGNVQPIVGTCGGGGAPNNRPFPSESDLTLAAAAAAGRENIALRQQISDLQSTILSLQNRIHRLEHENNQLRQLPTGKISQIPIEDMLEIMYEYGSEVSDTAMPPRKSCVQKASVVRQFRRWNPNFLQYFEHRNGRWIPKLGKAAELARREQSRREAATTKNKKKQQNGGDAGKSPNKKMKGEEDEDDDYDEDDDGRF